MKPLLLISLTFFFISACAGNRLMRAEKTDCPLSIAPDERYFFVEDIITKLQENYLHENLVLTQKEKLRRDLRAEIESPCHIQNELAFNLTAVLQSHIPDKHLEIRIEKPNNYDPVAQREEAIKQLEVQRYKIGQVEVKDGVGYLEMVGFANPRLSQSLLKKYVGEAFLKLNGAKALIIDLRTSGGGSPEMVATILSFVLPTNTVVNEIHSRDPNGKIFDGMSRKLPLYDPGLVTCERLPNGVTLKQFRTIDEEINFGFKSRLKNVPLVVLTSASTFSAPEELAYDLQQLKRATIVGEKTAGGANPRGLFKLSYGFELGIPSAEAKNPISRDNWEQRGVVPDVLAPSEDALEIAMKLLLAQIQRI